MDGQVIDGSFAGLAAPRQSFSVGRDDLSGSDRPGPFVLALIAAMSKDGEFSYKSDGDPGAALGFAPSEFSSERRVGADLRSSSYLDDDRDLNA